jgi:hypothetical protein
MKLNFYHVVIKDGKEISEHPTREEALEYIAQIENTKQEWKLTAMGYIVLKALEKRETK